MTSGTDGVVPSRRLELVAGQADELKAALAAGARAQHEDGNLEASRQSFERAYRLAEQAGHAESMALAALGVAGLWVRERRTVTSAVLLEARLQHVFTLLDPASALALRVRTRLAGEADYFRGTHDAILAALDEVRATGDPALIAEALRIAHHCLLGPEHVTRRRELAVELTKASFRTGRRGDLLMGLLWQTADAYCAGDPHAGRLLGELKEHLEQGDHLAVGFVVSAIDVMLAIRAGRFDEAEALAAACARRGAAAGDPDHDWWAAAQMVTIRWYQGRLTELLPMLHDRVHSPVLSAVDNSAVAALAVAAALGGDRPGAASSLATLCGSDLGALPRSSAWLVTMNGIVEAAYLLEEADVAARAYELLRPYADLPMIGSLGITCFGSAQPAAGDPGRRPGGRPGRAPGRDGAAGPRRRGHRRVPEPAEAARHRDRGAGPGPVQPGPGRTRLAARPAVQRRRVRRADAGLPGPARARPGRGGQGHPPGHGPDHRGRSGHR
jgi:hypothetical protein